MPGRVAIGAALLLFVACAAFELVHARLLAAQLAAATFRAADESEAAAWMPAEAGSARRAAESIAALLAQRSPDALQVGEAIGNLDRSLGALAAPAAPPGVQAAAREARTLLFHLRIELASRRRPVLRPGGLQGAGVIEEGP